MNEAWPAYAYGITSTIPMEIPLAAGKTVLDLNNRFIGATSPELFIRRAEQDGYPRTCCSWIKGLYGFIRCNNVRRVIFVTGGDCSNTHAMLETLLPFVDEALTFGYPSEPDKDALRAALAIFAEQLGTTLEEAEKVGHRLAPVRLQLEELDRLTWETGQISGLENFLYLLSSSDFEGNSELFSTRLQTLLAQARLRSSTSTARSRLRIGLLGVPPILNDLHDVLNSFGCDVVFNEIPRQFSLPGKFPDLAARYQAYTYPFGVYERIADIRREIARRRLHGLVHYTQSFCHRQIHDMVMRRELAIPMLTIEGESPGPCDARTRLRLESFTEILRERDLQ